MPDDYLTGVIPALRQAQRISCECFAYLTAVVASDRWTQGKAAIRYITSIGAVQQLTDDMVKLRNPPNGIEPALSTSAMCLDSMTAMEHAFSFCTDHKTIRRFKKLQESFANEVAAVVQAHANTVSRTYGPDDPLSAAWLVSSLDLDAASRQTLFKRIREALERLITTGQFALQPPGNNAEDHGWVAMTLMHSLQTDPDSGVPALLELGREWAIDQVRQQLSYRATSEPGFDPAHLSAALAASLEGGRAPLPLLLAGAEALIDCQRTDGSWTLQKPFVANEQGAVNLPIAPEMTIAVTTLIEALEAKFPRNQAVESVQLRLLNAVQRQRDWYYVMGVPTGTGAFVWSSEYAKLRDGKFHIWATARVVGALARLRSVESRLVTSRLVIESGLTARRGAAIKNTFEKLIDPETNSHSSAKVWLKKNLGQGTSEKKSALLYGPPGTSKTSMAEAVAKDRDEWLIEISPADFLIEGPNAVESRAKRLFDYLVQLEGAVVLFDEIDRLVLDRSTTDYKDQGDVFQFMTPSMLPKLSALWRAPGVRFLIATNYGESIDPAITRADRVDKTLLVPPPDKNARKAILESFKTDSDDRLFTSDEVITQIAELTPLWGYGELKGLSPNGWKNEIGNATPTITLDEYDERLKEKKQWRQVARLAGETLVLAKVVEATGQEISSRAKRAVSLARKLAPKKEKTPTEELAGSPPSRESEPGEADRRSDS